MKRTVFAALALLAGLLPAVAQLPQTLPSNTVVGRLGIGSGPGQAIPFSVLSSNLFTSLCTTSGAFPIYNATTGATVCSTVGGVGSVATLNGGPLTISPAPLTANQGLLINQSGPISGSQGSGCATAGNCFNYNFINISSDQINAGPAGNYTAGLGIQLKTGGPNSTGSKDAIYALVERTAPDNIGVTNGDDIGGVFSCVAASANGGTDTGAGARGTCFGLAPGAVLTNGALNYFLVSGGEVDVGIQTGGSAANRFGWSIIALGQVGAANLDVALDIGGVFGDPGFKIGIAFTQIHSAAGLTTTGTAIGTDGTAATVANFADFHTWTFSNKIFDFGKFVVNGAGTVLSLNGNQIISGAGTTTPYNVFSDTAGNNAFAAGGGGSIPDHTNYYENTQHSFSNIGGGTIFVAMATGATGIRFNQYGLGILHSSAAGVLSSSAIVSADLSITPTTCTNQFVTAISATGVGTCTTAALASAQFANQGTTTTILHGNAAGNPSFAAISLTADVTGTLGVGNGGTGIASATSNAVIKGGGGTAALVASGVTIDATNNINMGGTLMSLAPAATDAAWVIDTTSTGRAASLAFKSAGSTKWLLLKQGDDSFLFFDGVNSVSSILISPGAASAGKTTFGYTTASTSSATGSVVVSGGLGIAGAVWAGTYLATTVTTVNALPACGAGIKGARTFVSDNNTALAFAGVITTGGAIQTPVYCDGAVWRQGANDNIPTHLLRKFA